MMSCTQGATFFQLHLDLDLHRKKGKSNLWCSTYLEHATSLVKIVVSLLARWWQHGTATADPNNPPEQANTVLSWLLSNRLCRIFVFCFKSLFLCYITFITSSFTKANTSVFLPCETTSAPHLHRSPSSFPKQESDQSVFMVQCELYWLDVKWFSRLECIYSNMLERCQGGYSVDLKPP